MTSVVFPLDTHSGTSANSMHVCYCPTNQSCHDVKDLSLAHNLVEAIASSVFFPCVSSTFRPLSGTYLEPCQTSKMKRFVKLKAVYYMCKILHLRCVTGFRIRLWLPEQLLTPWLSSNFPSHSASSFRITWRSTIASQNSTFSLLSTKMLNKLPCYQK